MFCSKIPEFLHGIFGIGKTKLLRPKISTGSFDSTIPHNYTGRECRKQRRQRKREETFTRV
jgi:hypothetical protein